MKCDFCKKKCDGKLILKDINIEKKDGSDIILCPECLNYVANEEYNKIKFPTIKQRSKE